MRSPDHGRRRAAIVTRLEKIEEQIAGLSEAELAAFRAWFAAFDAKRWDARLRRDVKAGKLDALLDAAVTEDRAGRTRPL